MKISKDLQGRRIRKEEWHQDEWIKISYVGQDFAVYTDETGKEYLWPYDKKEEDWVLFYSHIPLTKNKKEEDVEE